MATTADVLELDAAALERDVAAIYRGLGADDAVAAVVARSLLSAHGAGHPSHGVQLAPVWAEYVREGHMDLSAAPAVVDDSGAVVRLDARGAAGPVAGWAAVELVRERAREHGVALALVRDGHHLGRLGEFTEALAADGFAAILLSNAQGAGQRIAPTGGTDRRLTNNPISLAMPDGAEPVVLDMALSAIAEGKIDLAHAAGEPLPEGGILDRAGDPSTDPADYAAGGLLVPMGGHKGVGLIVLVDLIVGVLSGGGVCTAAADDGVFFNAFALVAIDTAPLVPRERVREQVDALRAHLAASPRAAGAPPIRLPGQRAAGAEEPLAGGRVTLERATFARLEELARSVGVGLESGHQQAAGGAGT